jgi:hypothetical protein
LILLQTTLRMFQNTELNPNPVIIINANHLCENFSHASVYGHHDCMLALLNACIEGKGINLNFIILGITRYLKVDKNHNLHN